MKKWMLACAFCFLLVPLGCNKKPDLQPPLSVVIGSSDTPGYFVDAKGREVLLRGVNVNSYAEYWAYNATWPTTLPFTTQDMDFLAGMGYNFVRLLVTWSLIEPQPGVYDDAYLATIKDVAAQLWQRGLYTMVDMHQDAWGPYVAAREGEECSGGSIPSGGWDGAPEWATLIDDATQRCLPQLAGNYIRELVPAVREAWLNMLDNAVGPGGVGLQDRFAAMWGHVAGFMSGAEGVMGYDIINEPNALFEESEFVGLRQLYEKTLPAIRKAEDAAAIPHRVFVFEPSANWANAPSGATVERFTEDTQVAYGPHVYQGSIGLMPLNQNQLDRLHDEVDSYGNIPVIVGEWGASAYEATRPENYFARMIALQDELHWGSAHWVYQSACGDPHSYATWFNGGDLGTGGWGYRQGDCGHIGVVGELQQPMVDLLTRPALQYAPGAISMLLWQPAIGKFFAKGKKAVEGTDMQLFLPAAYKNLKVTLRGMEGKTDKPAYGGILITAQALGGDWQLTVE